MNRPICGPIQEGVRNGAWGGGAGVCGGWAGPGGGGE